MNCLKLPQWALAFFGVLASGFLVAAPIQTPTVLAPGYESLKFPAPAPGSYRLPALGVAADGQVLDSDGKETSLYRLMEESGGKVVVLSFIYSTCDDINGCPLATSVLHKIKNRLKNTPELARQVRLITLSFNPGHDTPDRMRAYGADFQGEGVDWRFVTTRSERDLQPILDEYQQNIQKIYDAGGHFTGTFAHNLRVYLIDKDKQLRNIYSVSFLHPDMLINDIKTVLQTAPGEQPGNITSLIAGRPGQAADLLKTVRQPPLGLPTVPSPPDNPLTEAKISLGRKLFYDRRLSQNNTISCGLCHIPDQGFTSNEMATAVGMEGRTVRRNSPTLYNIAYATALFHDGRETALEQQVWGPLLAHNEMANPSIGYVVEKIKRNADYQGLFEQAFGKPASMETIGMALAGYERTLNSANSEFDRWYYRHEKQALDAKAQRGFQLFTGKAGCAACHTVTEKYALFTDNGLHNTGVGYEDAMGKATTSRRVQLAPGVYAEVADSLIKSVSEAKANDLGRYEVTQDPADRWKYRTPSLRNISLTAPYMHNGSLATLEQVLEFYNRGGIANENLDPLIKPLHLSASELADLAAFLRALTGDNVKELVADGIAAPIGDAQ